LSAGPAKAGPECNPCGGLLEVFVQGKNKD